MSATTSTLSHFFHLPSLSEWQVRKSVRAWFGLLSRGERFRFLAALVAPAVNRVAQLAGFWSTMKGILYASHNDMESGQAWLLGGAILLFMSLAALTQWTVNILDQKVEKDIARALRRFLGPELARVTIPVPPRKAPKKERKQHIEEVRAVRKTEDALFQGANAAIGAMLQFFSSALMVALLATVTTVMMPWAGLLIVVSGLLLAAFYRNRTETEKIEPKPLLKKARKEKLRASANLVRGIDVEESLAYYQNNRLDRIDARKEREKARDSNKVEVLTGLASAVMVTLVFCMVVGGMMAGRGPVEIFIFIVAFRLLTREVRKCMMKWVACLKRKQHLHDLAHLLTGRTTLVRIAGVDR